MASSVMPQPSTPWLFCAYCTQGPYITQSGCARPFHEPARQPQSYPMGLNNNKHPKDCETSPAHAQP